MGEGELGQVQKNILELRRQIGDLNLQLQQCDAQNEQQRNSSVVNSIMEGQRRGELGGVLGRLGDLCCIERQYQTAISICCPQLNFIVVRDMKSAEGALKYLKVQKIGIATFLIIEKMQMEVRGDFKSPPNSIRLFDLVSSSS